MRIIRNEWNMTHGVRYKAGGSFEWTAGETKGETYTS
jgi:hypothetical protein